MDFNVEELGKEYFLNIQKFTFLRGNELEKNGYHIDDEVRRQIADNYKVCIYDVIKYLTKVYPTGIAMGKNEYHFNYQQMLMSLMDDTKELVQLPRLDATFKPLGDASYAVVSIKNSFVEKAFNLETIKHLPYTYKTPHFNELVEGISLYEFRDLLLELGVLPKDNIIDKFIDEYELRLDLREDFFSAVITKLLLNGTHEDVLRAYIFDSFMNVNYDFDSFKMETQEKRTK